MRILISIYCLLIVTTSLTTFAQAPNISSDDLVPRWLRQMDKDQDGRVANAESTGLMKRFFERNDVNHDNYLDQKELKALAQRLGRNRKGGQQRQPTAVSTKQMLAKVPDDVVVEPDIAYRPGDSKAWRLDLFQPKSKSAKLRPGLVFIHGGGWRSGDKRAVTFLNGAIEYAQKGYVTITVNYRLTGEAPFPACIEDVKCAVRWLRAHANKYHLDPERIGAYGNSAGAHLVAMLGLVKRDAKLEGDGPWQDQSSMVQAVAASATPTDFGLFHSSPKNDERFKAEERSVGKLKKLCSPINHVTETAPPFLLFHGTSDRTVDVKHSDILVNALKKAGTDVTYIRIDDAGHGVFNQHADRTKPMIQEFFERILQEPLR